MKNSMQKVKKNTKNGVHLNGISRNISKKNKRNVKKTVGRYK